MRIARLNRVLDYWEATLFGGIELAPVMDIPASSGRSARVLVLSVSAGSGHVRAADALVAQARAGFHGLSVRHRDMMDLVPRWFRQVYSGWYMKLASGLPEAWGWLYRKTDCEAPGSLAARTRRFVQRICAQRLMAEVEQVRPHAIVCTHFLPAEILAAARREKRLECPVWVQVTDFDLHSLWVHEGVSGYFVGNEELAYRLQAQGVPASRITISGIPVMPGFLSPPTRQQAAAKLGLDPARTTLLLMGGGDGAGLQQTLVKTLLAQYPQLQLIVLAGRNERLRQELQTVETFYPSQLRVLGFTDDVPQLMACADLAITKPGGLSTSECLVMGLPMLLVNPIPGQEERNAAWLIQEGAALRADDPATLKFRLARLLGNPAQLAQMRERALALAKPRASRELLRRVI